MPGISQIEGANLYENCIVALHQNGHPTHVEFYLEGLHIDTYCLLWEDTYDSQLERTYNDNQSVTERAAVGISVVLALKETDFTVIERSRRGTGFDYMLGFKEDTMFTPQARLEISGINRETDSNSITMRYKKKLAQTSQSDETALPAYISIVELSTPKALFNIKELSV